MAATNATPITRMEPKANANVCKVNQLSERYPDAIHEQRLSELIRREGEDK